MLFIIRTLNVLILLSAIHTQLSLNKKSSFDILFTIYLLAVLLHNLYIIPLYLFCPEKYLEIDYMAPWGIMHGPLLFLCFYNYIHKKISPIIIISNCIPFVLFWLAYFILFRQNPIESSIKFAYLISLYVAIPIFWTLYSFYVLVQSYLPKKGRMLMTNLAVFYILLGLFMSVLVFKFHPTLLAPPTEMSNITVSLFMLINAILLFSISQQHFQGFYKVPASQIIKPHDPLRQEKPTENPVEEIFKDEQIEKITEYFSSDIICTDLTIKDAATELNMTQKDLMEFIKSYYGLSFAKFITQKRIEFICNILDKKELNTNFDELATACGFRSSATFYRNFKEVTGYSPKAYYDKSRK